MNGKSIITNENLMRATAARIKNEFGNLSALPGATKNLEGLAPKMRHETLRAKLESKSANELLHSNDSATTANRLRRIGFTEEVIQSATAGGTTFEGRLDSKQRRLERLIGRNELLPVRYLDGGQAAAKAVARVMTTEHEICSVAQQAHGRRRACVYPSDVPPIDAAKSRRAPRAYRILYAPTRVGNERRSRTRGPETGGAVSRADGTRARRC
jgi:hypothetical protein